MDKNEPIKVTLVMGKFPSNNFVLENYVEGDEVNCECFYVQKVDKDDHAHHTNCPLKKDRSEEK